MQRALKSLWTYVAIALLAFYILLFLFLELPFNLADTRSVDPMRTLLGGLATGLITAQALVFTISLVAAQLNARYTHRIVSRVFTWPTGLYMGLFISSSVYSLVVLAALSSRSADFSIHLPGGLKPIHPVAIALALAGTCLVLLVPYLWSFKQRLDPERMALDEGRRARWRLHRGAEVEPGEVAALDNIVMSAFGYKDYDTFGRGLEELAGVGLEAWRLCPPPMGEAILHRIVHIGVSTIDDPRAPFKVIDVLVRTGTILADQGMQEAARQAAVSVSEIGEVAADRGQVAVTHEVAFSLSALGSRSAEQGLVSVAEEVAYSLGCLGEKTSRRGLEDSTRQVAASLRQVGRHATENQLDLATRQAIVSLWCLGGYASRNLSQCTEVVARELETMELAAGTELVEASYLKAPWSEELEEFHHYYLMEVRQSSDQAEAGLAGAGED